MLSSLAGGGHGGDGGFYFPRRSRRHDVDHWMCQRANVLRHFDYYGKGLITNGWPTCMFFCAKL